MMRGLGTVLAVFRAPAAPPVDDRAQVHFIPCEMISQAICPKAQIFQITFHKKMKIIRSAKPSPVNDLLRQDKYINFLQIFIVHTSDSILVSLILFVSGQRLLQILHASQPF